MSKGAEEANGCMGLGCLGLIIIFAISMCSGGKGSPENAAKSAADKEAGFHCLSGWDGSHREFVRKVKDRLRDPDSFEHDSTRVSPNKSGRHTIIMEYRARNGFGGMNRGTAMGSFDHESCAASEPVMMDD